MEERIIAAPEGERPKSPGRMLLEGEGEEAFTGDTAAGGVPPSWEEPEGWPLSDSMS